VAAWWGARIAIPVTCSTSASMSSFKRRCLDPGDVIAEAGWRGWPLAPPPLLLGTKVGTRRTPTVGDRNLQRAGVTVAIGGDKVQDSLVFQVGDFDPLELFAASRDSRPSPTGTPGV